MSRSGSVLFLDAAQVVDLHRVLLERWGGAAGGGHRGARGEGAEAAVQAVKNSYYDTLEELAAASAVYIVQGHVFLDGNKRTGAAALLTFLVLNGRRPTIAPLELAKKMLELQRRSERGERTGPLIEWLASSLRSPSPGRRPRGAPVAKRPRAKKKR